MMRFRSLALAALLSTTAGCIAQYRHIYSLDAEIGVPRRDETVARRPIIQLQRVLIPDYLDTTDILLRTGSHEIKESPTGRFAERLSLGVTHALRSGLAARLPTYTIALTQFAEVPARQILASVDEFEVWPTGRCLLIAHWSVLGAGREPLAADQGTFTVSASGVDPQDAALVAAIADAIGQLAERIAATTETVPLGATVPRSSR